MPPSRDGLSQDVSDRRFPPIEEPMLLHTAFGKPLNAERSSPGPAPKQACGRLYKLIKRSFNNMVSSWVRDVNRPSVGGMN